MVTEIKQIGTIVSDTGKLLICDPNFISEWKHDKVESKREYKDIETGTVYVYGTDFKKYDEILFSERTVNELITENRLVRVPFVENGEFSNKAVTQGIINKGYALCNFQDGRTGKAIAVGTLSGDGEFPVFAEYQDEQICKIWIDFTINIDDTIDNE